MTSAIPLPLSFQIGARTMFSVKRRLARIGLSLDDALEAKAIDLPPLDPLDHGYLVTSLPDANVEAVTRQFPDMLAVIRQRYTRRYAELFGRVEDDLATFAGKSRSTIRR